jgi:hypothetical protein
LAQSRDASSTRLAHPNFRSKAIGRRDVQRRNIQSAEAEIFGIDGLAVPSAFFGTDDTISRERSKAVLKIFTAKQREV